jgi:hypothetical protein
MKLNGSSSRSANPVFGPYSKRFQTSSEPSKHIIMLKISVFWDITLCSPVKVNQSSGVTCRLDLKGWRVIQARNQHQAGSKQRFHIGFLLDLLFDPEDGGYIVFRNIGWEPQIQIYRWGSHDLEYRILNKQNQTSLGTPLEQMTFPNDYLLFHFYNFYSCLLVTNKTYF